LQGGLREPRLPLAAQAYFLGCRRRGGAFPSEAIQKK